MLEEIHSAHERGQPVLVGTSSVEESERLSTKLYDIPHAVLNARNEEEEARIIAQAGQRGAVTISTNMAGRGVDIQLGPGAEEAGGLYVIGMNRHESRRIDHQLRGRAGRQGDPGHSRFFISMQDDNGADRRCCRRLGTRCDGRSPLPYLGFSATPANWSRPRFACCLMAPTAT